MRAGPSRATAGACAGVHARHRRDGSARSSGAWPVPTTHPDPFARHAFGRGTWPAPRRRSGRCWTLPAPQRTRSRPRSRGWPLAPARSRTRALRCGCTTSSCRKSRGRSWRATTAQCCSRGKASARARWPSLSTWPRSTRVSPAPGRAKRCCWPRTACSSARSAASPGTAGLARVGHAQRMALGLPREGRGGGRGCRFPEASKWGTLPSPRRRGLLPPSTPTPRHTEQGAGVHAAVGAVPVPASRLAPGTGTRRGGRGGRLAGAPGRPHLHGGSASENVRARVGGVGRGI